MKPWHAHSSLQGGRQCSHTQTRSACLSETTGEKNQAEKSSGCLTMLHARISVEVGGLLKSSGSVHSGHCCRRGEQQGCKYVLVQQ